MFHINIKNYLVDNKLLYYYKAITQIQPNKLWYKYDMFAL